MLSPIVQRNLKEVIAVLFLTSAYLTVTYAFSRSHTSLSATIAIDIAIAILAVCLITSTLLLKDNTRPNWKIFYIPLSIALIATSSTYIYFAYFDLRIIKPGHPTTEYILLFIYTAFLTQLALSKPTKNQNEPKYYWGDLLLLPLLCHPLINYISHNQDYFTARSTLDFFARLIGPPLALLVIAQYTQSKYLSYKLLTPVILSFFFVRYSMPMYTDALSIPVEKNIFYHLAILVGITAFLSFIYLKERKFLFILTGILLASVTLEAFIFTTDSSTNQLESPVQKGLVKKDLPSYLPSDLELKPDIYLLIYDSYVGRDLMNAYGINNEDQMDYLSNKGFQLHENLYTLYSSSMGSMARVFEMSNNVPLLPTDITSGNSVVNLFLQQQGYKTHYMAPTFFLMGQSMRADFSYPSLDLEKSYGPNMLIKGIAQGEFKFDLVYGDVDDNEWIRQKDKILSKNDGPPRFLYAHNKLPGHSQNSGQCLDNETELFAHRLERANKEMQKDIDLISSSGRPAIIIIAGDHGPYLTGDCYMLRGYKGKDIGDIELADRYGVLVSIKWPNQDTPDYGDIKILQDIFFSVFSYLGKDKTILDHRIAPQSALYYRKSGIIDGRINFGKDNNKILYETLTTKK